MMLWNALENNLVSFRTHAQRQQTRMADPWILTVVITIVPSALSCGTMGGLGQGSDTAHSMSTNTACTNIPYTHSVSHISALTGTLGNKYDVWEPKLA